MDTASEPVEELQGDLSLSALPTLDDELATESINLRLLVSAREAGCLIGQNGTVIDSVREETNTRAGISKLQPGSHERILTVSGNIDDVAKSLSYFAQALVNAFAEAQFTYLYFPLKQLSLIPNVEGETTVLRLLIPNAQMGTLIGPRGVRIQEIQRNCNVLMIASKLFLPGLNERLVELQGAVDNLYDALRLVLRCLIEDIPATSTITYYIPRVTGSRVGANSLVLQKQITATVSFHNDIVGALIGKHGARIQGVRKVSGATIGISEEEEGQSGRTFTITGTPKAVEKAKSLLYHNLEREEHRRNQAESDLQD
ncbi:CIC11C00000004957 [Sungouiella intermedia]|uniref:CIC11C00000004957 n=1 Tax=Sungouiella intermedia TaxID=45354 RepID=A0A1L0C1D2_9ASCO|nr:CIC11C00000004957 [[Candida] intermedia]